MSGTTTFLLKNVLKDLTLELENCSCTYYDQPKHMLYLGMKTGEIFAIRFELYQYKATAHPKLFFSPGFEGTTNEVVEMIVVKMPFHELTVGCGSAGLLDERADQHPRGRPHPPLGRDGRQVRDGLQREQVQEPARHHQARRHERQQRAIPLHPR